MAQHVAGWRARAAAASHLSLQLTVSYTIGLAGAVGMQCQCHVMLRLQGAKVLAACAVSPQEAGYNGIHFNQVAHSWVRDVRVLNSDSAFYSWGMVFCTIDSLEVASGDRGHDNGHRGIWLERGQDNLIRNFNFTTRMYHDLSVSFYEHSTAFVNGTGKVRRTRAARKHVCLK
jgi:hypothetical protein